MGMTGEELVAGITELQNSDGDRRMVVRREISSGQIPARPGGGRGSRWRNTSSVAASTRRSFRDGASRRRRAARIDEAPIMSLGFRQSDGVAIARKEVAGAAIDIR